MTEYIQPPQPSLAEQSHTHPAGKLRQLLHRIGGNALTEPQDPITDIAANVTDYISFVSSPAGKSDEEIETARESLLATVDLGERLGYKPTEFQLSTSHQSFYKENDPDSHSLTGRYFWVVKDEAGQDWLLKYGGFTSRMDGKDPLLDVYAKQGSDQEALAYQMAQWLGYPVPETKLVTPKGDDLSGAEGKTCIAYKYVADALDVSVYDGNGVIETPVRKITNQFDVEFRPVFNWLIGSLGDGFHQGIVDQKSGRYFAQDLNFNSGIPYEMGTGIPARRFATFEAAMRAGLEGKVMGTIDYPLKPFVSDANREAAKVYFDKLRALDQPTVESVLQPATPLYKQQKTTLVDAVVERAQALVRLYDEGAFEISKS